jgi:hypothetical protein
MGAAGWGKSPKLEHPQPYIRIAAHERNNGMRVECTAPDGKKRNSAYRRNSGFDDVMFVPILYAKPVIFYFLLISSFERGKAGI